MGDGRHKNLSFYSVFICFYALSIFSVVTFLVCSCLYICKYRLDTGLSQEIAGKYLIELYDRQAASVVRLAL